MFYICGVDPSTGQTVSIPATASIWGWTDETMHIEFYRQTGIKADRVWSSDTPAAS